MRLISKVVQDQAKEPGGKNHVWIYDRSQSMTWTLPRLGEDIKYLVELLNKGDTLTLSWFSTEGQFRTILKGFVVGEDLEPVYNAIDANIMPVGLTCFSEVLQDTVVSLDEVQAAHPSHSSSISFFSDGHPVVSDQKSERRGIFAALKELARKIGSGIVVGYGDYYNRPLLSQMAAELGATLVHADDVVDYTESMESLVRSDAANKVEVDLGHEPAIQVFGLGTGKVVPYPLIGDNKALVSDREPSVYVVTNDSKPVDTGDAGVLLARAWLLAQEGRIDEAIEWLAPTRDKRLLDRLFNAYTQSEIGLATQDIHDAAVDEALRMMAGEAPKNYVPERDAFCLLDALEELATDEEAFFYPMHRDFVYKRIGAKTVVDSDYPSFRANDDAKAPISSLVWSSDRLNLSVRVVIPGYIHLPPDSGELGLPDQFQTYQYRTYSLVRDGVLNVRNLPVTMGRTTFATLRGGKLVPPGWTYKKDQVYTLDLRRIPVMNRAIAEDYTSATDLAQRCCAENILMAELKVLRWLLSKHDSKPGVTGYSKEQASYLADRGIRSDGSYSPPSSSEEMTDYYVAGTLKIQMVGWSSLPSVDSVIQKIKDGDKLNAPGQVMADMWVKTNHYGETELRNTITTLGHVLQSHRDVLNRAKFAVLLGHAWFDEFDGKRDNAVVTIERGGEKYKVKFVFGEKKVKY